MFRLLLLSLCGILFIIPAEGQGIQSFRATPTTISVGSSTNPLIPQMRLECLASSEYKNLFSVQILKYSTFGTANNIATVTSPEGTVQVTIDDAQIGLRATAMGSVSQTPSAGQPFGLRLDFSTVICQDQAMYQCLTVGFDASNKLINGNATTNVTVSSPIGDMLMTFEPSRHAPMDKAVADFVIGAQATMQCRGDVGQQQNRIRWCVKLNTFFNYEEQQSSGGTNHTQSGGGVGPSCGGWIGTSILKYNISTQDTLTVFKCLVENQQQTCSSLTTNVNLTLKYRDEEPGPGQPGPITASADVGAIVGGIIGGVAAIVLIVLLVYFLWYRRRGEGEDYRTKEEDEGRNNQTEPYHSAVYSIPDKTKNKEKENKGMDSHADDRERDRDRHQYRNDDKSGHRNRAMDEDDGYDGRPGRSPAVGSSV